MRDVDDDIRSSLERLTDPAGGTPALDVLWGDLVTRRRRRRNRNRTLAALPLLLIAVFTIGVLSIRSSDDEARTDVAASGDGPDALDDFPAFEMTYRTLSYQAGELVPSTWELNYESASDWELVLVEAASGGSGQPWHRQRFLDGTLTDYAADGTVISEEDVEDRVAPMALMSRGPRTGKAEGGGSESTYRHEYTSSREVECPDDPTDGGPYCEQPGETVVVETVEVYNNDGVPVFSEERIRGTDRVVWQFEMVTYERTSTSDAGAGTLRVRNIQVFGNGPLDGGTERAVIVFNEALPAGDVQYVPNIGSPDPASGAVWTTQGPNSVDVCDSQHGVPDGAVGSVDLLVPASWFADEDAHTVAGLATVDDPAKFPVCGPYNGFIQYAMWSPLSADPVNVTVTVSPDRTTITIDVGSAAGGPRLDPTAGQGVVAEFLDRLRGGDVEAAAGLWTGYPELGPDSTPADRVPYVEDLLADQTLARILNSDATTTFVTPSTDDAGQVVTILDARDGDTPPAAITFLTGWSGEQGSPGAMRIHRLPLDPPPMGTQDLGAGSYVDAGQNIVVPGVPLEGGARAFLNDREVPVEVDYVSLTMTITIPDDVQGDGAVTVVMSSPELPDVRAFAVTVR